MRVRKTCGIIIILILISTEVYTAIAFVMSLKKAMSQPYLVSSGTEFHFLGYYFTAYILLAICLILIAVTVIILFKIRKFFACKK